MLLLRTLKLFCYLCISSLLLPTMSFLYMPKLVSETKILAFAGSTRTASYNKNLIREAADVAKEMGASVTVIDLKEYPIPHYDRDVEEKEGMPINAKHIRKLMIESNAIIISTPQYNASISSVLKNVLDWCSRGDDGNSSKVAFIGKKFAIMSAATGTGGGAKALAHLRSIIEDIRGYVINNQVRVPFAMNAFGDDGRLKDPVLKEKLKAEIQELLKQEIINSNKRDRKNNKKT